MASDVNRDYPPGWNPLACSDTPMLPNTLLMAKLSVLILLADGFWRQLQGPFVPTPGIFPTIPEHAALTAAIHLVFFGLAACILFNRSVRPASASLGAFIILLQTASMTAFRGPDFLCGSLLLLAGLQGPRDEPVLIRWQVVLVHAVAAIEATRANDWGGTWVANRWIPEDFSNPVLLLVEMILPTGWFGTIASGFVVLAELGLVVAFLQPRFRKYAIWGGLILHTGIYAATGTTETAAFTAGLFVSYLSFLNWPKESVCALWPRSCGWPMWLRIALDRYDFDGRIDWPLPPDPNAELEVSYGNRHRTDARALRDLLLLFPAFYFCLFVFAAINQCVWPVAVSVTLNGTVAFGLLWFFSVSSFSGIRSRWRNRFSESRY